MRLPPRRASGRASAQRYEVIAAMFRDGKSDAEMAGAVGMTVISTRLARQKMRLLRTGTQEEKAA